MASTTEGRVAVYIDFDNIVISRYEQKHSRGRRQSVNFRDITAEKLRADPELASRLDEATVDLEAVLDFASSFGAVAISRAYADWSLEVNASYKRQLMKRAVDLVQLFPAVRQTSADRPAKNGADIRLSVDVIEDLFQLPDLTHVVIVAGDSDYIALAQRCKRLGRYVVGIGVAGSTSTFLAAACNEFADYDALPGVTDAQDAAAQRSTDESEKSFESKPAKTAMSRKAVTSSTTVSVERPAVSPAAVRAATELLRRALRLCEAKSDEPWIPSSAVKNQMLKMDPAFQESALGHPTFTAFVKSRHNVVELKEDGLVRLLRLKEPSLPSK